VRPEHAAFGWADGEATRIYFGNEFCEHLAPGPREILGALDRARRLGLALSLVLPYAGPSAFARIAEVLETVAAAAPGTEIVANDWGVLRRAAADARLVPVMGRCLYRVLRDPRLPLHVGPELPAAARDSLRGGGALRSAAFADLRARLRIARIEIDVPPLGLPDEACFPPDLPLSIYVPFGFVASGRVCVFASIHRPSGAGRFAPGTCRRQCRTARIRLEAPATMAGSQELVLAGNTVFYRHDAALEEVAAAALDRLPIDRVVHQSEPPMR
jgi:hypothetical protein